MNNPRLMRLQDEEIEMLERFRALPQEYQDHLRELAEAMLQHVQAADPSNVIRISDPFRKFR